MASDSPISTIESPAPEVIEALPDASTTNQASRKGLNWTSELIEALLIGLVDQVRQGNRPIGSFKPEAYKAILPVLQGKVLQRDSKGRYLQITVQQVRSKVSALRISWGAWDKLRNESGVGRDPETGAVTASDDWWDTYLHKHAKAKPFRNALLQYENLYELAFGDTVATGQYAAPPGIVVETPIDTAEAEVSQIDLNLVAASRPSSSLSPISSSSLDQTSRGRETPARESFKRRKTGETGLLFGTGLYALTAEIAATRSYKTSTQSAVEYIMTTYWQADLDSKLRVYNALNISLNTEIFW